MTTRITRADLEQLKGISPKLTRFFEDLFATGANNTQSIAGTVDATGAIQDATVLTLSSNAAFGNERVLLLDPTQFVIVDGGPGGNLEVGLVSFIMLNGGFACALNLAADTNLDLPTTGKVPSSSVGPYADDTAAQSAGVEIGEIYKKTGGTVVWRQV